MRKNTMKPIGRLSAEKVAALNKICKMMEAEERKGHTPNAGVTCFVQDAAQIDFLKMIMPDGTNFKVIR